MGFWRDLFLGDPEARYEELQSALDPVLDKFAAERQAPDEGVLCQLNDLVGRYRDAIAKKHRAVSNDQFPSEAGADFYLAASKLGVLGDSRHSGWPFLSGLSIRSLTVLTARLELSHDPWLRALTIPPALAKGEIALATRCWTELDAQPVPKRMAIGWVQEMMQQLDASARGAAGPFLRQTGAPTPWNEAPSMAPELHWICLASIYPSYVQDPRSTLAAAAHPVGLREALKSSWDVEDQGTTRNALQMLLKGCHSAQLSFELAKGAFRPNRQPFLVKNRQALERHRIRAWDLCRAIVVARGAARLGYVEEPEAVDVLLALGEAIRQEYATWEDLGEDYALGRRYFNAEIELGSEPHLNLARWLLSDEDSPWKRVPFGGTRRAAAE